MPSKKLLQPKLFHGRLFQLPACSARASSCITFTQMSMYVSINTVQHGDPTGSTPPGHWCLALRAEESQNRSDISHASLPPIWYASSIAKSDRRVNILLKRPPSAVRMVEELGTERDSSLEHREVTR